MHNRQATVHRLTGTLAPVAALVAVAAAVGSPALADGSPAAPKTTVISNEKTLTRWAYPNEPAIVHSAPSASATRVARLHAYTEDGRPEIYLALRLDSDESGVVWAQIRLPMRPNGRTGWVLRDELGPFHTVLTRLVVDRRGLSSTLYRRGRAIWASRIGVGKPGTSTPGGHFYVREKLVKYASRFYGPIAFGTSAYSSLSEWPKGGVVGIHGTSEPQLIPGRVSHGCIRVPNRAIHRLALLMPLGTPVLIR
jgi:hypothetical protein